MILLTQNLLVSPMAGASDQKPLGIEATEVEDKERDYDADFLKRMLERIDYDAFVAAARTVCASNQLCCFFAINSPHTRPSCGSLPRSAACGDGSLAPAFLFPDMCLCLCAHQLGKEEGIPATRDAIDENNDTMMRKIHYALLEVIISNPSNPTPSWTWFSEKFAKCPLGWHVQFFEMLPHAVPRLALGLPHSLSRTMQRPVSKRKFPRLPACILSTAKPGPFFFLLCAPLFFPPAPDHAALSSSLLLD
jgi:hypothetical protein